MSTVHNFIVLAGPPHDDADSDNLPAPWMRLDRDVIGDGKGMEGRVWGRAVNHHPNASEVAAELRAHVWWDPDEVMLLAKEQDWPEWRVIEWRTTGLALRLPTTVTIVNARSDLGADDVADLTSRLDRASAPPLAIYHDKGPR